MSVPEDGTCRRLTAVFQCISTLWRDRANGRFEVLERALIDLDLLAPMKKNGGTPIGTPPQVSVLADGSPYPANVIVLKERLRERAARRRGER